MESKDVEVPASKQDPTPAATAGAPQKEGAVKFGDVTTIPPILDPIKVPETEEQIQNQLNAIREILQDYPLQVERTPQKGRYIVASRDIAAGEVVMRSEPFAASVTDHIKTKVCSFCFTFSHNKKMAFSCAKCNEVWYCSSECRTQGITPHHKYECDFFKRMRKPKPKFDPDAYGERFIYLKRMEDEQQARMMMNRLKLESDNKPVESSNDASTPSTPPPSSDVSTPSSSSPSSSTDASSEKDENKETSTTTTNDDNNNARTQREHKYEDIFVLVSNDEKLHPLARDYIQGVIMIVTRAMEHYLRYLPFIPEDIASKPITPPTSPNSAPSPPLDTIQYILDIICKQRCNRFGIWSKTSKCLGVALSPAASFFNHSCAPNCLHEQEGQTVVIRAIHPIPKGTEMCISYVKLDQSTDMRKEELFVSYHFYCCCLRCKDTTGIFDEWLQNFYCDNGKCEPLLVPLVQGSMDTLHCDTCGATKKFTPKRIPDGVVSPKTEN